MATAGDLEPRCATARTIASKTLHFGRPRAAPTRVSERPICGREGGQQGARSRTSNLNRPRLWEVGTTPADMAGAAGPAGEALGGVVSENRETARNPQKLLSI